MLRPSNLLLLAAAAAPLAVALAAYAVHPRPDVLADVTWSRFLIQAVLPGGLVLAEATAGAAATWGRAGRHDVTGGPART